MILTAVCEACREEIGVFDTDNIGFPWSGEMFKSIDPGHDIAPPFRDGVEWEHSRCPMGPHRPFIHPDRIKTTTGLFNIVTGEMEGTRPGDDDVMLKLELDARATMEKERGMTLAELRGDFECSACGRRFKRAAALGSHKKACERKRNG